MSRARRNGAAVLLGLLAVAGCSSAPPPPKPPLRTGAASVPLETRGLACLAEADEVVAVHHQQAAATYASTCDLRSLDYLPGAFGLLGAVAALGVAASCRGPDDGVYVDVAATTRDAFVEALKGGRSGTRVTAPATCPVTDSAAELARLYNQGPVVDFRTVDWQSVPSDGIAVFVPRTIRGRLLEPGSGKVLWEEGCDVRLTAASPQGEVLKRELETEAQRCGAVFAAELATPAEPGGSG